MSNWNLEVSAELAENVESCLREFGQDAELDLALLVDDSGAMIAGVASRQDIDVATVGVMVATTYSGVVALSKALGDEETGDCVIHGSDNNIYLRSAVGRFVLLGVSELALPIGLIREKASQICTMLEAILLPLSEPSPPPQTQGDAVPAQISGSQIASPAPDVSEKPIPEEEKKEPNENDGGSSYVFEIG